MTSIVYKAVSFPSFVLTQIGKRLIGDPRDMGLNISAEEFYSLEVDRPMINTDIQKRAGQWEMMTRNLEIDYIRRKVFARICIYACIFSIASACFGGISIYGINKTKAGISSVKSYFSDKEQKEKDKEEKLASIKKQSQELIDDAKAGKVTKAEYEVKAKALNDEYNEVNK